ncbi:MAG TPA: nitrogenase molybdenum-cofactor biosynthesis protein NifE, partial [Betaproteobacteria bacterium]|nr:nitrogenase molybdenum-cofactor biosynthesis protein NifE [Betaproteobacteria bacterium]
RQMCIRDSRLWVHQSVDLKDKRVLLITGGVKSWSVVAALQEVGMDVVGTSTKKSTPED